MRKMYLLFSLALLLAGVNMASAKLVLGKQKTSFADGDRVIFQGCSNINNGTEWKFGSWLYAKSGASATESIYLSRGGSATLPGEHNGYIFELQDAGTSFTKNGKTYQGFYLYCPGLGKYAVSTGSNYFFKKNKERARVFYLIPPAEYALIKGNETFETNYPGIQEALKTAFNLVIRDATNAEDGGNGKDGYNYTSPNRNMGSDKLANAGYVDWAIWLYVFEGSDVDDPSGKLIDLTQKVEPIVTNGVVGTWPGYVADAEAFEALKTAYGVAIAEGADAATAYSALQTAYDKFCEYGVNGFVPLTDGFWRIQNANTLFFENQGVYKAMSAAGRNLNWGDLDVEDKAQVWKVTATSNPEQFTICNVVTAEYLNVKAEQSKQVTTSADSISCLVQKKANYVPKFIIGNGYNLHANYHQEGNGLSGNIVGWNSSNDNNASLWNFVPVDNFTEEELQGGLDQLHRNDEYAELLLTAMNLYRVAVGFSPYDKDGNNLITYTPAEGEDPSVKEYGDLGTWKGGTIKCNYKQSSEGSYGALCDGLVQNGSFFHSQWSKATDDWHHLQFDLEQPIENVAFFWDRRVNEGTPRRISKIDVQVCPDTVGGGVWTTVASLNTDYVITDDEIEIDGKPVLGNDEVITGAAPLFGSYKHIRMVVKEVMSRTVNKDTGLPVYTANSGLAGAYPFFSVAELHILGVDIDPNCQMATLKGNAEIAPIIEAMEAQFAKAVDMTRPTAQDMLDLQKAYDDFVAVFPDPAPLVKTMTATQDYMANMYVGGVPGTYETEEALAEKLLAVNLAIENAQADIDDQTLFTKQQVDDHIAAIEAAKQALIDGARPIDFTKWVRLYISREYWAKNPDLALPSGWVSNSAMYAPETAESEVSKIPFDVFDPSIAQSFDWRFIPVTDGYIIQSRSTGKFIGESRSYESSHSWYPALSSIPAVFTVEPIGGGSFVIGGVNLDGSGVTEKAGFSEPYKYLHGAVDGQSLAYWETKALGSRSGWEFEIQRDDAFTEQANTDMENAFTAKNLVANKLYTGCYPTSVTLIPEEGQLNVYTVAGKDADESVVYLRKIEESEDGGYTIPGGTSFVYEMGEEGSDFTQYVETEDEEASYVVDIYYEVYPTLNAGENDALFVNVPEETAGIVGLFSDERVYKGHGLVSVYESSNAVVPYWLNEIEEDDETIRTVLHRAEAYIDPASATVLSTDEAADCLALPVAGKVDNAIEEVAGEATAGTFDVYTIDGIRVRTGVNKANALKGLKSGLYIINKQKVVVK